MPASYAHHRFGDLVFPTLPAEAKRTVQRFRQLYDVGQHGPDLFFYYQPLFHTKMGELGSVYHRMTGKEFFGAGCSRLRENPSEGGEAYLLGVLGHYVLDSAVHPMINGINAEGKVGHTELETEFDRYLLTADGEQNPHTRNLGSHVRLTWGEAVTVAQCYPPAGAFAIRQSVFNMAFLSRMLALKNRKLVKTLFSIGGKTASQSIMYPRPNHKCVPFMEPLETLFAQAQERYPHMAAQLLACMKDDIPLSEEFNSTFG